MPAHRADDSKPLPRMQPALHPWLIEECQFECAGLIFNRDFNASLAAKASLDFHDFTTSSCMHFAAIRSADQLFQVTDGLLSLNLLVSRGQMQQKIRDASQAQGCKGWSRPGPDRGHLHQARGQLQ